MRLHPAVLALGLCTSLSACAGSEEIPLSPSATRIEIITSEPDRGQYEYAGDVTGSAKGSLEEATQNARNDLRNRAARLRATVVKLDTSTAANAMDWTGRNQVVLMGRAFRPKVANNQD
jgi:hypothetical protein